MSQLKPSFINEIRLSLEKSRFTTDDFELELPKSGNVLAKISFLHKPEYFLALLEEQKREQVTTEQKYLYSTRTEYVTHVELSVRTVPGAFKLRQDTDISELGEVLKIIPKWCDSIRDDLYALMPAPDPLEELRQQFKSKLDEIVNEPNTFFSEEELAVVDKRFDQLYEEISQLREQHSLTKQQLDAIQKEIEEFKKSARAYPKGIWAKITSNKLLKTTGQILNSPEGRALMFQGIRRVLGLPDDQG